MRRALQLDPLSLIMKVDQGVFLCYARQYERSIAQLRGVLEMEPDFSRAQMIVSSYVQAGRSDDALAELQKQKQARFGYWIAALEVQVHGRTNRTGQAKRAMEDLQQAARKERIDQLVFVGPYLAERLRPSVRVSEPSCDETFTPVAVAKSRSDLRSGSRRPPGSKRSCSVLASRRSFHKISAAYLPFSEPRFHPERPVLALQTRIATS